MVDQKISCSIGILIHNEAENIANLLDSFCTQKLEKVSIKEIIVVSSASTDGSDDIVRNYEKKYKSIKLIAEPERRGKSAAINTFLEEASEDVAVIASGDIIPAEKTVERMVSPFLDEKVGMTGSHPVPVNTANSFCGYLVNLQWRLHHRVSMKSPKLGEMVAFRRVFERIPEESAVDEASIEAAVIDKELQLIYVPDAVVFNRGPENISDFIKQRRRIAAGHKWLKKRNQYRVSTNNPSMLLSVLFKEMCDSPTKILMLLCAVALELFCRILGWYDLVIKKKNPYKWARVDSTKKVR